MLAHTLGDSHTTNLAPEIPKEPIGTLPGHRYRSLDSGHPRSIVQTPYPPVTWRSSTRIS